MADISRPAIPTPENTADAAGAARPADAVVSADSVLHSVVVYASGALCRRRARVALPGSGGPIRVRLGGLPLALDAHSLRGRLLAGPAGLRVLDVRREVAAALPAAEDLSPLQHAADAAEVTADSARAARAALAAQIDHVAALRAVPPTPRRGDPPRKAPTDALLALADFVDGRLTELQQRLLAAEDALREAEQQAETARRRLRAASAALPVNRVESTTSVLLTLAQGSSSEAEAGSGAPAEAELELEYGVPGATWTPTYHLRLDGIHGDEPGGSLTMRACVAQRTGEDWTGVRLGLSTADLRRRTDAPELRSLRIGRRQAEPAPPLWREPPSGLTDLFSGYDTFVRPVPAPDVRRPMAAQHRFRAASKVAAEPDWMDQEGSRGVPLPPDLSVGYGAAPPPPHAPAPAPGPPPAEMPRSVPAPGAARTPIAASYTSAQAPSGAAAGFQVRTALSAAWPEAADRPAQATAPAPGEALRDYAQLVLAGADEPEPERGQLQAAAPNPGALAAELRRQAEGVAQLALPPRCLPVRHSAGSFDHRYDTVAPVDVPADGVWHTVPVLEFPVDLAAEHVCVPAVDARVYAAVRLGNTSSHALLAGAAEVSVDGAYLMTVQLPTLAPGQHRRVGIGVVESVQVARRIQMRESTAGLRSGTTVIDHGIEIELANRLGRPVTVEVRERVPVSGDKDVRVEEHQASPPWTVVRPEEDEKHQRGMRVWRVTLAPGARTVLTGGYEIRVPAAKALFDGNRRL
ncbi:hypothetical protein ABIA33_005829 [Streptacidiphilus sp. MAP12-16]|uniref:DUF4139 domain-containing protein n=1 Tax=Streptacidiphilus sp. MAP12-16 TaxID=3156300 RepID=UPI0035141E26